MNDNVNLLRVRQLAGAVLVVLGLVMIGLYFKEGDVMLGVIGVFATLFGATGYIGISRYGRELE